MEIWIIVTLVSLLFSGLFSGAEMAFVTSDRVRVEIDVKQGGIIGRILRRFYANPQFFISSILVGNNIVLVIYGMGAAAMLKPLQPSLGFDDGMMLLLQTIVSTIVIIITGEFLPKTIFRINPNTSMRFIAIPIFLFYIILYPIALLATAISRGLMRLFGLKSDQVEIKMISVSDLNDYLEDTIDSLHDQKEAVGTEVKIFQNALDFSNTHLRDCMIPRNEIVAAKSDTSYDELSKLFTSSGRSKILVYREDIDDIIGYIHVSELFDPSSDWHEHIKPVLYAPEALLANKMMRRLLNENALWPSLSTNSAVPPGWSHSKTSLRKFSETSRTSTTRPHRRHAIWAAAFTNSRDGAKSQTSTTHTISTSPKTMIIKPLPDTYYTTPGPSQKRAKPSPWATCQ